MNLQPSPPREGRLTTLLDVADTMKSPDKPSAASTGLTHQPSTVHETNQPDQKPVTTSPADQGGKLLDNPLKRPKATFGELLMEAVDNPELDDVIGWTPSGEAFEIRDSKKFVHRTMPEYFAICNMSSFVRKLNRWGFHRASSTLATGSSETSVPKDVFQHPHFVRGEYKRCREKVCSTGEGSRKNKLYRQKMVRQLLREEGRQPAAPPSIPTTTGTSPLLSSGTFLGMMDPLSLSLGGSSVRSLGLSTRSIPRSVVLSQPLPVLPPSQQASLDLLSTTTRMPLLNQLPQPPAQQLGQPRAVSSVLQHPAGSEALLGYQHQLSQLQLEHQRRQRVLRNLMEEEELLRQQEFMIRQRQLQLQYMMLPADRRGSSAGNSQQKSSSRFS